MPGLIFKNRCFLSVVASLAVSCVLNSIAGGQESQTKPNTIAFNIRLDQLMKHSQIPLMLGVKKDDPTISQIESIQGVASLPTDFNEMARPDNRDDPPFDFYIQIEMKEDYTETKMFEQIKKGGKKLRELDGVEFYSPSPESKSEFAFSGKSISLYSAGHRYQPDKLPKMNSKCEKVFQQKNQNDAMIIIDFKDNRELIDSFVEFGETNMPPMAEPYLGILEKLETGAVSVKLKNNETLFELKIDCSTEDDANRLNQMLDELIQMAKAASGGEMSASGAVVKTLDSLKSRVVGKTVEGTMMLGAGIEKIAQRTQLTNNAKQTVISMHNFESAYQRLPFHANDNESEQISWRVKMLPFLAQGDLYDKFDMSKPWDSPENKKLLDQMPNVFGAEGTKTNLSWIKSDVQKIQDIKRGTSNTIAFVYSDKYVPWTENNDVTPDDVLKQYTNLKPGEFLIATMYDGSVRNIAAGMDPAKFEEMLYPSGKEQQEK